MKIKSIKEYGDIVGRLLSFPLPITRPAAEISLVSRQSIIGDDSPIPSVHASTVLPLSDGSVLAAWFGGKHEKNSDVRIWFSKRDVYGAWSKPKKIESDIGIAHWNPVLDLRNDSSVRLYYKRGEDVPEWETWYCDSFDGGVTFSVPSPLVPGDSSGGRGPVKNKCLRTKQGLLLAPASSEQNNDWRLFIDISRDDGETWERTDFIEALDPSGKHVYAIQPTLWQDVRGDVHFLCRTAGDGYIYRSDSFDGGLTWCTAYRTGVRNNDSGIDCCKSADGRLWLLCNPVGGDFYRSPLRLLVSCDNGRVWLPVADLERFPFGEYSYPAITCVENRLYCTYTSLRKNITFAQFLI